MTEVTATATDATGNSVSASFWVTVEDTHAPALVVPEDIVRECTAAAGTNVSFTVTASDVCGSVTVVCKDQTNRTIDPAGTDFGHGVHTVTCTATDASNNTTTDTFLITIEDTTKPVIVCPEDITVGTDAGECFARVNFTVTATDLCDPNVTVTIADEHSNTVQSGDAFPVGTTVITATAQDRFNNTVQCSFNITVEDREDPAVTGPATKQLVTDCAGTDLSITAVDLGVTATDNCTAAPTVSCSPSTLSPGTTTVTCTATDDAGNSSVHVTTVTVLKGEFDCLILRPLDPGVDNRVRRWRPVPIKVRVTCNNTFDPTVTATIDSIVRVTTSGTVISNDVIEDNDETSDPGILMRLNACREFYVHRLRTRHWNACRGARYRVTIRIQKPGHVDTTCDVFLKVK